MSYAALIPTSYAQWRVCIEQRCHQPLTREFCERRLVALRDAGDSHTQDFRRLYGEPHLAATLAWFERALTEAVSAPPAALPPHAG